MGDVPVTPALRPESQMVATEVTLPAPGRLSGPDGAFLIEFGEHPVRTLSDFRAALARFRPGDMPAVGVRRRGRPLRVLVRLDARR